MKELSFDERQKIAFEAHSNYVDEMYKRFGLVQNPGHCIVEIQPMLVSAGGFFYDPQDHIWVNDVISDETEIVDETCHESGHFLHPFARREYQNGRKANNNLCEIVSHLGSLVYFRIKSGRKRVTGYLERSKCSDSKHEALIAKDIFEANMGLLEKIAQSNMEEIISLISPHLQRPFYVTEDYM